MRIAAVSNSSDFGEISCLVSPLKSLFVASQQNRSDCVAIAIIVTLLEAEGHGKNSNSFWMIAVAAD